MLLARTEPVELDSVPHDRGGREPEALREVATDPLRESDEAESPRARGLGVLALDRVEGALDRPEAAKRLRHRNREPARLCARLARGGVDSSVGPEEVASEDLPAGDEGAASPPRLVGEGVRQLARPRRATPRLERDAHRLDPRLDGSQATSGRIEHDLGPPSERSRRRSYRALGSSARGVEALGEEGDQTLTSRR